jgi:hypothetical protein
LKPLRAMLQKLRWVYFDFVFPLPFKNSNWVAICLTFNQLTCILFDVYLQ